MAYASPDQAYQEALRRIEEARETGAVELDLSEPGLKSVPPGIGRLSFRAEPGHYKPKARQPQQAG